MDKAIEAAALIERLEGGETGREMDRAFKKAFYDDGNVDAAIASVMERTTFSSGKGC